MTPLPTGDPAPPDGHLPDTAIAGLGDAPFGIYVHVPFCRTRCGYCDFNTYTAQELRGGMSASTYAPSAIAELRFARAVLGDRAPAADTIFLGGGTPTLLAPGDIGAILDAIAALFGVHDDAEITVEANPETVDERSLATLRAAGITRISLGMQSSSPRVLELLDREHTPGRAAAAAREARAAGFEHVSLDLIYGTPGETQDEWRASLEAALAVGPDHVSAYGLTLEPGTRMHARVRGGALPAPDDDAMADRYLLADELLAAGGLRWYEVSNWALRGGECRHNLGYWRGGNWWGAGPGAHSHFGGVRWWNVLHPAAWARRVADGVSPAAAREALDQPTRELERVMLETRLSGGVALDGPAVGAAQELAARGLVEVDGERAVLTLAGRLLADAVIRDLTP